MSERKEEALKQNFSKVNATFGSIVKLVSLDPQDGLKNSGVCANSNSHFKAPVPDRKVVRSRCRKSSDNVAKLERKMQKILERLGLSLVAKWVPDATKTIHGEIKGGLILIYDVAEQEALVTVEHEILEFKFQEVSRLYRGMVNSLLDVLEKEMYKRKEGFFDCVPIVHKTIKEVMGKKNAVTSN